MAAVEIGYKGGVIATMDGAGATTLKTGGTYCEGDIVVAYTPRVDDSFRRWDVYITGEINNSKTTILQDDWLKTHRADANLCVAILPKFTVKADAASNYYNGCYLVSNSAFGEANNNSYKSVGALVSPTGATARTRKFGLTEANDVGDALIDADGTLSVIAITNYAIQPGEYCVVAWLM